MHDLKIYLLLQIKFKKEMFKATFHHWFKNYTNVHAQLYFAYRRNMQCYFNNFVLIMGNDFTPWKAVSLQFLPILPDDILGYIDSDLLLSLMPLADLSGTSLEFIDAESPEHIDEAALAQQQVCIKSDWKIMKHKGYCWSLNCTKAIVEG